MTFQKSVAVRNASLDAQETRIGPNAVLKIRTGAQPANSDAPDSGTVLATLPLPSDWMLPASGGSKSMSGTWTDNSADATGIAAHWRIYEADGVTCHWQGSITATGDGGNMTVDNVNFAATQAFSITGFTITSGNP